MTCKCQLVLCFDCRTPEIHRCNFDYMKQEMERLTKNNPVVTAEKLDKI